MNVCAESNSFKDKGQHFRNSVTLLSKSTVGERAETCNYACGPKVLQKTPAQNSKAVSLQPPHLLSSFATPAAGWIYTTSSLPQICLISNQISFWPSENLLKKIRLNSTTWSFTRWTKPYYFYQFQSSLFLFSKVNNARIFSWPFLIFFLHAAHDFVGLCHTLPHSYHLKSFLNTCLNLKNCSKCFIEKVFMTLLLPVYFFDSISFSK